MFTPAARAREYTLTFNFLPHQVYKNEFCVKPKQVMKFMSKIFFKKMYKVFIQGAKDKTGT